MIDNEIQVPYDNKPLTDSERKLIKSGMEQLEEGTFFSSNISVEEEKPYVPIPSSKEKGIKGVTYVRKTPKIGRNDLCPCGSQKKYKKCCLK